MSMTRQLTAWAVRYYLSAHQQFSLKTLEIIGISLTGKRTTGIKLFKQSMTSGGIWFFGLSGNSCKQTGII